MGYLTTHPLPTHGSLGKQPELPKKTLSCPLHAANAVLPLPKMKCGGYRRKEPVQSPAGESRELFSIPSQGSKHSTVHVYSPVSPLPLLLHSQCLQKHRGSWGRFAAPSSVPGVCGPIPGPSNTKPCPRHGVGLAVPPQPRGQRWRHPELAAAPAEHEAVGQQSCPAGRHEPGLAAAVAPRGSLCPR